MHGTERKNFSLKYVHNEQCSRLQQRYQNEAQLLEDLRLFVKQKCVIEKAYGQSLMKLCQQFSSKIPQLVLARGRKNHGDSIPLTDAWKNYLHKMEELGRIRVQSSEGQGTEVTEVCKQLRIHRAQVAKLVFDYLSDLQKECLQSSQDVQKSQKIYKEKFQKTREARLRLKGCTERTKSPLKLQSQLAQVKEELNSCEARSDEARNVYLLDLASSNSHLKEYRTSHLLELIQLIDGEIHEDMRRLLKRSSEAERRNCMESVRCCDDINASCDMISKEYDIVCFLGDNPCFTEVLESPFMAHNGDEVSRVTLTESTERELNREARRSAVLAAREEKAAEKCQAELEKIKMENMTIEERAKHYEAFFNLGRVALDSKNRKERALSRLKALQEGGLDVSVHVNEVAARMQAMTSAGREDDVDSFDGHSMSGSMQDGTSDTQEADTSHHGDEMASGDQPSTIYPYWCSALYDYEAVNPDELSFKADDRLKMIGDGSGDGWLWAENENGTMGLVPQNYISTYGDAPVSEEPSSHFSDQQEDPPSRDEPIESNHRISVLRVAPPPPIEKEAPKVSSMVAPVSFPSVLVNREVNVIPSKSEPPVQPAKLSDKDVFWVRALYSYEATSDEELSFSEGQLIKVVLTSRDVDDGWWEGEVKGRRGIFPSMIVEEVFVIAKDKQRVTPMNASWKSSFNLSGGIHKGKDSPAEDDDSNNNNNNNSNDDNNRKLDDDHLSIHSPLLPPSSHTKDCTTIYTFANPRPSVEGPLQVTSSIRYEDFSSRFINPRSRWLDAPKQSEDPRVMGAATLGRRHPREANQGPRANGPQVRNFWDVPPNRQSSNSEATLRDEIHSASRRLFGDVRQEKVGCSWESWMPLVEGQGSTPPIPSYNQLMMARCDFSTVPRLHRNSQPSIKRMPFMGPHHSELPYQVAEGHSLHRSPFRSNDYGHNLPQLANQDFDHGRTVGSYYTPVSTQRKTGQLTTPSCSLSYPGNSSALTNRNADLGGGKSGTFRRASDSRESYI